MIRIGIIDTGVNMLHPDLHNKTITCKVINNNEVLLLQENCDQMGHGTAICGIISNANPNVEIVVYKTFDTLDEIDEDTFLQTLEFISENENFDILNLSVGISSCFQINRLEQICRKIYNNNTLIVSSFNNYGTVTYPAAFPFVIGVDWDIDCKKNDDFIYCDGGIVNVYAKGINQRLCWSPQTDYIVNSGASFATAHVTAYLASIFDNANKLKINEALTSLKERAIKKIKSHSIITRKPLLFKKIALFPFNKEIISITNYSDILNCEISNIFDVKQIGNVGKSTLAFSHRKNFSHEYIVKNIETISEYADTFDTLVVGHLPEINRLTKNNYTKYCIDFCLTNKKSMISFDTIMDIILEQFTKKEVSCFNMNISNSSFDVSEKLRIIGKPILTILGTASKQGKFSLQLELRKKFLEEGYKIGQWTSEPQGYLFGIDQVFPVGYGSNLNFHEKEIIHIINNQLHQIELLDCDIIISGLQSHLITDKLYNTHMYPTLQNAILSALQSDAIILVVNAYDKDEYIMRTINYAQSLANSKIVCLALSFKKVQPSWSPLELSESLLSQNELYSHIEKITALTNIPCFSINDIKNIFKSSIDYLA